MKVLFVCSGNSEAGINPIIRSQGESLIAEGIEIDYFMIKGRGIKGYYPNIRLLRKHLQKNHYDLIHAHYGFCGIISHLARKSEKLVVSFMGEDLLASYNPKGSITFISRLYVRINLFFAKKFFDFVIVKSEEMAGVLKMPLKKAILANGVNMDIFKPEAKEEARKRLGIADELKLVIFVSDPSRPEKNWELAKKAFDLISFDKKELKALYNIQQQKLPSYYNAADALLLTSYHEGSPNVIKEAIACNCPVVSTDVGDVREVIGNIAGCSVTSFDAEEIASALENIYSSGRRINGRETIFDKLDSRLVARKLISLYQEIIKD